jgi:hypothetical protein
VAGGHLGHGRRPPGELRLWQTGQALSSQRNLFAKSRGAALPVQGLPKRPSSSNQPLAAMRLPRSRAFSRRGRAGPEAGRDSPPSRLGTWRGMPQVCPGARALCS